MKHFLSLLFVCLLLLACGAPQQAPPRYTAADPGTNSIWETYPVYIDADFTPPEKQAIHAALEDWNLALNGYRKYEVADDDFKMEVSVLKKVWYSGQGLIVLRNQMSDFDEEDGIERGTLAFVPRLGAPVIHILEDSLGTRDLKAIVMHEMGHTLGIPHILIKGSIMFPSYPFGGTCIDKATVQTLSSVQSRFDWHHLRFCLAPQ